MVKRFILLVVLLLAVGWLQPTQAQSGLKQTTGTWSNEFAPARSDHLFQFEVQFPLIWNEVLYATTYAPLSISSLHQGAGVVYWDGHQWLALGNLKGRAAAITIHQDRLYVVGQLIMNDRLVSMAYWDGQTWTVVNTTIIANWANTQLASFQNELYLSNNTTFWTDPLGYNYLVRWDGTQWHKLNSGINGTIAALAVGSDGLYIGGSQLYPFNSSVQGDLVRWDGTQWQAVGSGLSGKILELTWANNQLYVGGRFSIASSANARTTIQNIAAWNGTAWQRFGKSINLEVHSIVANAETVYVLSFDGYNQARFYDWNGLDWEIIDGLEYQAVDNASPYPVGRLVIHNDRLVALGNFVLANQRNSFVLDGNSWQAMMQGGLITGTPFLSSDGEKIYAWSNNQPLNWGTISSAIAYYDQNYGWFALGSPEASQSIKGVFRADNVIYAATEDGLYRFVQGTTWQQISAITGINQLAVDGDLLYIAGDFDQFDQQPAHHLGTWDGHQWHSIAAPASFETISAFDVLNGIIYITDGAQVARWNGQTWSSLATNVDMIKVLEATPTGVYVGGTFSQMQGITARKLAYWQPTGWQALDSYLLGDVYDLELGPDGLYVAGRFYRPASLAELSISIARWDGVTWQSVGGGLETIYSVYPNFAYAQSLAATPSRMYVGGSFRVAGGYYGSNSYTGNYYQSLGIAAWNYPPNTLAVEKSQLPKLTK